jgi:hypothetical protein
MRRVTFHTFVMGDVDDPEIYAAQPLWDWQQTEQGQWVMAHCANPTYLIQPDGANWGHRVVVSGELEDDHAVFHELKWGQHVRSLA